MDYPVEDRRQALGSFLRSRRERLSPEAVGLPPTGRRRTPGLRREEVAQLAGISPTWYLRLEQGKDVSASPAALDRIARALHFARAERAHLFALAERRDPLSGEIAGGDARLNILQQIAVELAFPAYVLDRRWNMRAWNKAAAELFSDLLGGENPNILEYVFLDPRARMLLVDWADRARRHAAECRAEYAYLREDPAMLSLLERLRNGSEEFVRLWEEQQVLGPEGGLRKFLGKNGEVDIYEQISLFPGGLAPFRLVILVPSSAG